MKPFFALLLASFFPIVPDAFGDKLTLLNGSSITGTVLQTNGDNVLFLTDFGTLRYGLANIKSIENDSETNRLSEFNAVIKLLSKQHWATNLLQIPATVIDNGVLKNVPYVSFKCGEDYEFNLYGDFQNPAGIEVGIYRKLTQSTAAKLNCLNFVQDCLTNVIHKDVLRNLNLEKDSKQSNGLTFEITPPTDQDAYGGWWVSVYSETRLNSARASEKEMQTISIPKATAIKQDNWSQLEVELSRPAAKHTITFTNKSGMVVRDAEVVRVNEGDSLVWHDASGGGVTKFAELPPEIQSRYGYDPEKIARAEKEAIAARARHLQQQQVSRAIAEQGAQAMQALRARNEEQIPQTSYSVSQRSSTSGSGRVYVKGYTKEDGTYVPAHTRSAPRRR